MIFQLHLVSGVRADFKTVVRPNHIASFVYINIWNLEKGIGMQKYGVREAPYAVVWSGKARGDRI